jgi:hypothetical protein
VPEVAVTYTYGEPYGEAEVTYIFAADDLIPHAHDEVLAAELSPGDRILLDGDVFGTVKDARSMPLGQRAPPGHTVAELEASGYRRVIGTVKHIANTVIDITVGGETLTATPDHPFWVVNRNDWVRTGDLRPGDLFATAEGQTLTIESVSPPRKGEFTVYNLEVEGLHTYHAGKHAVLVHNAWCLRKALVAAGRYGGKLMDAHHIVAQNSRFAGASRAILSGFGIGVNEAANGVWLARGAHRGIHTKVYYDAVFTELSKATSRAHALQILQQIRSRILSGSFPH